MTTQQKIFTALLKDARIPEPVLEHRFHPVRKWRFDYAWLEQKVALEVEGGVWIAGRHTSGAGFVKDMEKYNAAAALGWRIIRAQPRELTKTDTINLIKGALT